MATSSQDDWIARVLSVRSRSAADGASDARGTEAPVPAIPTVAIWRAAKDSIDLQLSGFAQKLRATGHPLAIEIAERGLTGVTAGLQVGIMAALLDYDAALHAGLGAVALDKAAAKVRNAAARLRNFVATNKVVALLDANQLGAKMYLAHGVTNALAAIEARLAR